MNNDQELRNKKSFLLEKHVFKHLKDLNSGFDSHSISYFSPEDFKIVLLRIKELGFGVTGIEPWKDDVFFDVATFERTGQAPEDPEWYLSAFERFYLRDAHLQYSATYSIPDNHILLENLS